jgi:hypothetical protein
VSAVLASPGPGLLQDEDALLIFRTPPVEQPIRCSWETSTGLAARPGESEKSATHPRLVIGPDRARQGLVSSPPRDIFGSLELLGRLSEGSAAAFPSEEAAPVTKRNLEHTEFEGAKGRRTLPTKRGQRPSGPSLSAAERRPCYATRCLCIERDA